MGIDALLSCEVLVDTTLSTDTLIQGLAGAVNVSANALARRGQYEKLAELGMSLPAGQQLVILAALARSGMPWETLGEHLEYLRRSQDLGPNETVFWQQVLSTQTLKAAHALEFLPRDVGSETYGPLVTEALRKYWREEVTRAKGLNADFAVSGHEARLAIDFLGRSQRKQDIPLLQELLSYRGYESGEGAVTGAGSQMVPAVFQRFGVREAAVYALRKMGVQVPHGTVLHRTLDKQGRVIKERLADE
ncbi:MAG: hypothetical protein JNG86_17210, partial [Verrucomicrobiaceae bacterium]|nr:hypothetical protein [Verrucomicrobiaceae bacterium]